MNPNDVPAFPYTEWTHGGDTILSESPGMTLRDYFAAKVLPACYAETCRERESSGWPSDWKIGVALDAYAMADAMLAARGLPS